MKISNNTLAALIVLFILFSSAKIITNSEKIIITGKAATVTGTAKIMVLPSLAAPSNLDANVNTDGKSIDLNWTNVSSAQYYIIYYSSNLDELVKLNLSYTPSSVSNITNIMQNYITDTNAGSVVERYYRVASVKNSLQNISGEVVGKYTYTFYGTVNPSNAHRAENWISIPFNVSFTAESFMNGIKNGFAEKMTKLIRPTNSTYQFYTHIHKLNDGKNFNLVRGEGYAVFVNQTVNHTIAGDVPFEKIIYTFQGIANPSNAHRAENWFSIPFYVSYYAEDFMDSVEGSEKMTKLIRTNSTAYQFYTHIHDLPDNKNFNMKIAEGYALFVNQTVNHTTN